MLFDIHKEHGAAEIEFYLHKDFRAAGIRFYLHKRFMGPGCNCPCMSEADLDENHHFMHRQMAKHSKNATGAILMKIVILSCRLGGILFRLENAPGCAPIS